MSLYKQLQYTRCFLTEYWKVYAIEGKLSDLFCVIFGITKAETVVYVLLERRMSSLHARSYVAYTGNKLSAVTEVADNGIHMWGDGQCLLIRWSGETSPRWINIQQIVQGHSVAPHRKAAGITGFDLGLTKDKGSFHDVFSHTSYCTAGLIFVWQAVVTCLILVGLSSRRHRFDPRSVCVGSVVDKVTPDRFSSNASVSPVFTIPSSLDNNISFIYNRCYVILVTVTL